MRRWNSWLEYTKKNDNDMSKYIDADKLRAEIESCRDLYNHPNRVVHGVADAFRQDGRAAMCEDILSFLDTLEEPVSEDLEDCLELNEAAEEWVRPIMRTPEKAHDFLYTYLLDSFRKGAEWQKDKDTEAVIVAEDRGFLKGADWARAKMMVKEDGK